MKNQPQKKIFTFLFIVFSIIVLIFFFIIFSFKSQFFPTDNSDDDLSYLFQEKRYINPTPPPSGDLLITPGESQAQEFVVPIINSKDEILGNPNAHNTIFIVSNFAIKYAKEIDPIFDRIHREFGDQVVIIWQDYIDEELYPDSAILSNAAHCAGEQNKFWEYKNILFTKNTSIANAASLIGLDSATFNKCLNSGKYDEYYEETKMEVQKLDIPGIPIVYINGNVIYPDITYEAIISHLE